MTADPTAGSTAYTGGAHEGPAGTGTTADGRSLGDLVGSWRTKKVGPFDNPVRHRRVGDALLQEVAAGRRAAVRASDTVSRFGGDEQEPCRPILVEGDPVVVAASIGIAVAEPGITADTLLRRADAAMCEVKARARSVQP